MDYPNNVSLNEIYDSQELDYTDNLVSIGNSFEDNVIDIQRFINQGQWLEVSLTINKNGNFKIEKLFFVEDYPSVVFVNAKDIQPADIHKVYNEIWCMARPRFLFVENLGEIKIYDLANEPAKSSDELVALETVKSIADILKLSNKFKREYLETGEIFNPENEIRFGNIEKRADFALIADLKKVRKKLQELGLTNSNGKKYLKYAHSLIGRSIFVRYLEDRGILTTQYFYDLAENKPEWLRILQSNDTNTESLFVKILSNPEFTYSFFNKLTEDFNGDIFPSDHTEKEIVNNLHLTQIQNFLLGNLDNQLFFFPYKFDIIPIEIISNIYEEFYHTEKENQLIDELNPRKKRDNKGTHYTPASLVEFVLSRVLTVDKLEKKPRVIDPACGSGIFLVETFRRIVRYELFQKKKMSLEFNELLEILKNQIFGVELNDEAVKIAAFSLYLAFLHYQNPPDIRQKVFIDKQPLPNLIKKEVQEEPKEGFDILIRANTFDVDKTAFLDNKFDIVVGNPPWGNIGKKGLESKKTHKWLKSFYKELDFNEYSQSFIFRSIHLLKNNAEAGLLISTGVFYNHLDTDTKVKKYFLHNTSLQEIINFSHTRDVFFNSAISPFFFIKFKNRISKNDDYIQYWALQSNFIVNGTKSVILHKADFKLLKYIDTKVNDIWKIYWFGNYRDLNLISGLRYYNNLKTLVNLKNTGAGFATRTPNNKKTSQLGKFYLPTKLFNSKYKKIDGLDKLSHLSTLSGSLSNNLKTKYADFFIPEYANHLGKSPNLYKGLRILVKRGIEQKSIIPKGQIVARLHNENLCFRNSIFCIHLKKEYLNEYRFIVGLMWSSLFRYYFFMTASTWVWHNEIHLEEILNFPIVLPENQQLKDKVITLVDILMNGDYQEESDNQIRFNYENESYPETQKESKLLLELDETIFKLYSLTDAEIDLIQDRCNYDIDFFYHKEKSKAVKPVNNKPVNRYGIFQDLPIDKEQGLMGYLQVFMRDFSDYLEDDEEINFQFVETKTMLAVIFNLQDKGQIPDNLVYIKEWKDVLKILEKETLQEFDRQVNNIYLQNNLRIIRDNQIIIIKRNEQRLWTRSEASIDAESCWVEILNFEEGGENA